MSLTDSAVLTANNDVVSISPRMAAPSYTSPDVFLAVRVHKAARRAHTLRSATVRHAIYQRATPCTRVVLLARIELGLPVLVEQEVSISPQGVLSKTYLALTQSLGVTGLRQREQAPHQ